MGDSEAKKKWQKENTVGISARLSKNTDADIIAFMQSRPEKPATLIKIALREYITTITTPAKGEKGQGEKE